MVKRDSYHEQQKKEQTKILNALLKILPLFVTDYFHYMDQRTSINTQVAYARNIQLFFSFMQASNPQYATYELKDFKYSDMEKVSQIGRAHV